MLLLVEFNDQLLLGKIVVAGRHERALDKITMAAQIGHAVANSLQAFTDGRFSIVLRLGGPWERIIDFAFATEGRK